MFIIVIVISLAIGKVVGLDPGHIVLDGDPVGTQPPTAAPPHFQPMPIVAKQSPISEIAELLFQYGRHVSCWICFAHVWTTREEHLVVFIIVQNLVGIGAVISIIYMILDFAHLA